MPDNVDMEAPPPAVVQKAEEQAKALQQTWDRNQGDMLTQFGEQLAMRWQICKILAASRMVKETRPEAIMAIMLKAFELGVPVMQALAGMYFVDGKVGIEGHLMDAMAIPRCGVTKTIHENSTSRCHMTLHREGWEPMEVEYTIDDAIRAELVQKVTEDGQVVSRKKNWVRHPEEMLYWRALSKGLKRIAPDFFGGIYTEDELEDAAEMKQMASQTAANEELDALAEGRDVTALEAAPLSDEEMEQLQNELAAAVDAEAITDDDRNYVLGLVVEGDWNGVRQAWEGTRQAMLAAAEPPATKAPPSSEGEQETLL